MLLLVLLLLVLLVVLLLLLVLLVVLLLLLVLLVVLLVRVVAAVGGFANGTEHLMKCTCTAVPWGFAFASPSQIDDERYSRQPAFNLYILTIVIINCGFVCLQV